VGGTPKLGRKRSSRVETELTASRRNHQSIAIGTIDRDALVDTGRRWLQLELVRKLGEGQLELHFPRGRAEEELEPLRREAKIWVERPAQMNAVLRLRIAEKAGAQQRQSRILHMTWHLRLRIDDRVGHRRHREGP
jgi:hypothetical protein